jgi:hypothetical protein
MMGPPVYFHPSNPHSGLHWETPGCTDEPPHCRVVPEVEPIPYHHHSDGSGCYGDPNCTRWHTNDKLTEPPEYAPMKQPRLDRPNHYQHDVLGDPETCTGDHNHPEPEPPTGPAGVSVANALKSPRASALDEAQRLITGDRNNQYGPPTQDFKRTADLLNALGYHREDATGEVHEIKPSDVAIIIAQVKVSRIMHSRGKRDSWVDLAGYAGCGYECAVEEENGHA